MDTRATQRQSIVPTVADTVDTSTTAAASRDQNVNSEQLGTRVSDKNGNTSYEAHEILGNGTSPEPSLWRRKKVLILILTAIAVVIIILVVALGAYFGTRPKGPYPQNHACSYDTDCQGSLYCIYGSGEYTCQSKSSLGGSCSVSPYQCFSPYTCQSYTCVSNRPSSSRVISTSTYQAPVPGSAALTTTSYVPDIVSTTTVRPSTTSLLAVITTTPIVTTTPRVTTTPIATTMAATFTTPYTTSFFRPIFTTTPFVSSRISAISTASQAAAADQGFLCDTTNDCPQPQVCKNNGRCAFQSCTSEADCAGGIFFCERSNSTCQVSRCTISKNCYDHFHQLGEDDLAARAYCAYSPISMNTVCTVSAASSSRNTTVSRRASNVYKVFVALFM